MILQLDCNAHKPLNSKALKAFVDFNDTPAAYGHPLSPSIIGRAAANAIEESRSKIANLLGAKSNQIFFANGCTQACEWAVELLTNINGQQWISPTEHPAIKQAAYKYFNPQTLLIDQNGTVDLNNDFENKNIICIYVQNEIGIIQPIDKIKCNYLLSDMSQAAGKINIDLSSLDNVDCAIFAAHKFAGPSSIGFFYLKDTSKWKEFGTGSRYFMDRPGTPDTASIVATAVALEEAVNTIDERYEKTKEFQTITENGIKELGFKIIAESAKRVPHCTFAHLPEGMGIAMMMALGKKDIHIGLGSACGSMYAGTSPLMKALGIEGSPEDFVRISQFGQYGAKEAKYFLDQFNKCLKGK